MDKSKKIRTAMMAGVVMAAFATGADCSTYFASNLIEIVRFTGFAILAIGAYMLNKKEMEILSHEF